MVGSNDDGRVGGCGVALSNVADDDDDDDDDDDVDGT